MDVPMIYGRITSNTAVRLFNAVISTGAEAKLQRGYRTASFYVNDPVKALVAALETAATRAPNWIDALTLARAAVRKFIDYVIL